MVRMSNFFEDSESNHFIEEWIEEWISQIRSRINDEEMEPEQATEEPHEFLMNVLVRRTHKALHTEQSAEGSAKLLNENIAALIEWQAEVIRWFEISPDYWRGVCKGAMVLYIEQVNSELRTTGLDKFIAWHGGRFITAKDLKH